MASPSSPPPSDSLALSGAKFMIPQLRRPYVERSHRIRATASSVPVVAITAPAGYGKTTFLTEWARSEDRTVAWISLDRFDDEPTALLGSIATALGTAGLIRDFGWPFVADGDRSALVDLAPRLAAVLAAETSPFVLMLDDFHEVRDRGCHDALDLLLTSLPAGSQFIAASRSQQPYVPRRRVQGDLVELGPAELALDRSGAQQVFAANGHDLSSEVADRLVERTEGWPAALYLAALVAGEALEPILDISGDDVYVADYLHQEALSRLPAELQTFLVRTSALERFSAGTCNAVMESSDAERWIREIDESNLFLVPLDRHRLWFRYHPLFREFLVSELRRIEPGVEPALHRRASAWFDANDEPELAVSHMFLAGDPDDAVPLVQQHFRRVHHEGRVATTRSWLEKLGPERIAQEPGVAILACWQAALSGDAFETFRIAERLDEAGAASTQVHAQWAALRSALCRDGIDAMAADAELAWSIETPSSVTMAGALTGLAEARLAAGRTEDGVALIDQAVRIGRYPDNSLSLILGLADLTWFAMDRSDWRSATETLARAVDLVRSSTSTEAIPTFFMDVAAARLNLHLGDQERARSAFTHALRSRAIATHAMPTFAIRLRLRLGKVAIALGLADTAGELHRECLAILEQRPRLGALCDAVEELGRHVALAAESRRSGTALTVAELRLLPYLQTHLNFREIGERLYISRNTVSTQAGSIYRKLGVSTRSGAVDEATQLGLLGS